MIGKNQLRNVVTGLVGHARPLELANDLTPSVISHSNGEHVEVLLQSQSDYGSDHVTVKSQLGFRTK